MGETRRMHFVPRTYLKYFAEDRGWQYYLYALTKETGKIFNPNIANVCLETDLYLLDGDTEEERQALEKLYRELFEDGYDAIYKILTDDKRDYITMEERYDIISFVVSMFYRNNSWVAGYNTLMDETIAKAFSLAKENGKDSFFFGEREISITGKSLEDLQKEDRDKDRQLMATVAMENIFKLTRLRVVNDVVTVIKTTDEMMTSDNPVTFRAETPGRRPIPLDPTNTLSIPIDKYHLLQLRPWGDQLDRTLLGHMSEVSIISAFCAEENNRRQYAQTGRFLLGSESGIKQFNPAFSEESFKSMLRERMFRNKP
jgi:hypothetical protein